MTSNLYLAFVAVSVAVIVIPGPSIMLIVSNGLQEGRRVALVTVAGTSIAMLIQLAVALAGLTSLIALLTGALNWLRWPGIAYLVWLGIRRWRDTAGSSIVEAGARPRNRSAFAQGFLVSLLNPTTMLFFIAFFPQFLVDDAPMMPQLLRLALTFWAMALGFDCLYAVSSAGLGTHLQSPRWTTARGRAAGGILIGAALALALART